MTAFNAPFVPVESSNIKELAYDPYSRELRIRFHTGAVYAYEGVDAATYGALLASPSHGKYFSQYIKNQYKTQKL